MGRFSGTDGVGILWFEREDYDRFLALVDRSDWELNTFEEWEEAARDIVALVLREGGNPVPVECDPDKLLAWCKARGLRLDSAGRQAFAADPANWPASIKH